jgi:hypothetical protein
MSTNITIKLVAMEGDSVLVENYKSKYKPWERGIVRHVNVAISKDKSYTIGYTVILERKSPPKRGRTWETILRLYVGERQIRKISKQAGKEV